jgi:tRNA(Ile)-lysidine synthase TilS/MesJ
MTKCDKCQGKAIIHQRYSGMHLCQAHFDQDVHRKIRESLRRTRRVRRGARVAIGLSGGKKSATLFYVLKNLFSCRSDIDLLAVIIDEGREGRAALGCAQALADRLEVPYFVKSLPETACANSQGPALKKEVFSPCGISFALKKHLLEEVAQEMGADVLATGHNLDDEALDIFINYLRGNVEELLPPGDQIAWVKPLQRIPEREVRLYAITHSLCAFGLCILDSCPNAEALQREAKRHLDGFDSRHPGTKYSLLHSMERVLALKRAGCKRPRPEGQSL